MVVALGACGPTARLHRNYALPMTAARLARINNGDALVSYLRQRDANPAVCVPSPSHPHVRLHSRRELEDAVDGIGRGVRVEKWASCMSGLLRTLPAPLARVVVDRLLERYAERIVYPRLDRDRELRAQVAALRRVYEERPHDRRPSDEGVARVLALIDRHANSLSRSGARYATALRDTLQLERGLLPDGTRITVEVLDRALEAQDERTLRTYSRRLPDPQLRYEARHRLVRLRVRRSPFHELRARETEVVARVLRHGRNVVTLAAAPPRVSLDLAHLPARGLVVVQDVGRQRARLLSFRGSESNISVVPPIDLRGLVHFEVSGFSRPLTVCARPDELDPSPCIDPRELSLGTPFASMDGEGRFRFREALPATQVLELARYGDHLPLPILFRGEHVAEARWPMRFRTTGPLVLAPAAFGAPGPQVDVEIDATGANVVATVRSEGVTYFAVGEHDRIGELGVIAAGGEGAPGQPGVDGAPGAPGTDGQDASCPSTPASDGGPGGAGGPGGNGGPGGDGGPGGVIRVTLVCPAGQCGELQPAVEAAMGAPGGRGGRGGEGGRGGPGGHGGRGGNGASCNGVNFERGRDGAAGAPGPDGLPGPDGRHGPDGQVIIRVETRWPPATGAFPHMRFGHP